MCAGPGGRMRPPVAGAHARQRGPVHAPGRSIIELMDPASGIGIPVAFGAGLVSFLSPCVLPLVPGYISAVAGVLPGEIPARRALGPSPAVVASFSALFIALGLLCQQALPGALTRPAAVTGAGAVVS